MIHLETDSLRFEFQSKVAGFLKSSIKTLESPLSEVDAIEYKPSLFSTKLELGTNRPTTAKRALKTRPSKPGPQTPALKTRPSKPGPQSPAPRTRP